jgi:hypothetical protein
MNHKIKFFVIACCMFMMSGMSASEDGHISPIHSRSRSSSGNDSEITINGPSSPREQYDFSPGFYIAFITNNKNINTNNADEMEQNKFIKFINQNGDLLKQKIVTEELLKKSNPNLAHFSKLEQSQQNKITESLNNQQKITLSQLIQSNENVIIFKNSELSTTENPQYLAIGLSSNDLTAINAEQLDDREQQALNLLKSFPSSENITNTNSQISQHNQAHDHLDIFNNDHYLKSLDKGYSKQFNEESNSQTNNIDNNKDNKTRDSENYHSPSSSHSEEEIINPLDDDRIDAKGIMAAYTLFEANFPANTNTSKSDEKNDNDNNNSNADASQIIHTSSAQSITSADQQIKDNEIEHITDSNTYHSTTAGIQKKQNTNQSSIKNAVEGLIDALGKPITNPNINANQSTVNNQNKNGNGQINSKEKTTDEISEKPSQRKKKNASYSTAVKLGVGGLSLAAVVGLLVYLYHKSDSSSFATFLTKILSKPIALYKTTTA